MIQAEDPGRTARPSEQFRHAALFYAGERDFVEAVGAFIRDGVAEGEPTLVVVDARKIDALREHIADDTDGVCFADMAEVGTNPGAIISAWDDFVAERGAEGQRVRGVGEPVHPERTPDELVECHRHEALLNLAFADAPGFWLLCPYDVQALDADTVAEARASHPLVVEGGVERHSDRYAGLQQAAAPLEDLLPPAPARADGLAFDADALPQVRQIIARYASNAGLTRRRGEDLLLAVNELATNSVRHGGGSGELRVWADAHAITCEVSDTGTIDAPLAGRRRPSPGDPSGYGLWMVNQLCDLVQVRAHGQGGVVRLHMRLD
jgi:anti-sigma regulatory factor (Ser/Thr protein kinase)